MVQGSDDLEDRFEIVMEIRAARVLVDEARDLRAVWSCQGRSFKTKTHKVDVETKTVKFLFSERFEASLDASLADRDKLTLFCDSDEVGAVLLDLAALVGQMPQTYRLELRSQDSPRENHKAQQMIFSGNTERYRGAMLEFRLTVTSAVNRLQMSTRSQAN